MTAKRSPFTWFVVACLLALVALLIYGVVVKQGGNKYDNAVVEGKRLAAPTREVRMLDGPDKQSLADYRGKVVLLNFWASWCMPCKQEAPAIERAKQRYEKDGLVVLGADVDDLSKDARKFMRENKLTYPSLRYSSSDATRDFGTRRMPETFVIDRQGRVAALKRMQVDSAWLNEVLPPILAESGEES